MAFNSCLKAVKQKILHCISMSAYILSIIAAEFSGVTGITAAIVKKVKKPLRFQAVKEWCKPKKPLLFSFEFWSIYCLIFKIHPLTLLSFASHFILSAPQEIFSSHFPLLPPQEMQREGNAILFCRCLFSPLSALAPQINPSSAFSQRISSAVSHHMLPFPQIPLGPSILSTVLQWGGT